MHRAHSFHSEYAQHLPNYNAKKLKLLQFSCKPRDTGLRGPVPARPTRDRIARGRAAPASPPPPPPGSPADAPDPPTVPGTLPLLEDLPKVDLARKFESHHRLLNECNSRVLMVRYLGKRTLLVREPDDVAAVLNRQADNFAKHPRQQRVKAWLGAGLATQADPRVHAAQREILAPAFRADYVRQLDGIMAAAAARLAAALLASTQRVAAAGPKITTGLRSPPSTLPPSTSTSTPPFPSPSPSSSPSTSTSTSTSTSMPPYLRLDFQELFKRHSLDVLGLASLDVDFRLLGRTEPSVGACEPVVENHQNRFRHRLRVGRGEGKGLEEMRPGTMSRKTGGGLEAGGWWTGKNT
ncbi:hypothetical protein Vafri_11166 [Volvox africanus]|nr:hypothetical protein Vafri_11166 [Volvox africanus]